MFPNPPPSEVYYLPFVIFMLWNTVRPVIFLCPAGVEALSGNVNASDQALWRDPSILQETFILGSFAPSVLPLRFKHFCNTFSSSFTCTVSRISIYEALLCNDRPSLFSDRQRLHPFVWCAGRRGWQIPLRACLSEVSAAHIQTHLAGEEMKILAGLPLHYDISRVLLVFSTAALQWSQHLQSCLLLFHLFFLSAAVCAWIWVPGFSVHCETLSFVSN